MKKNLQNCVVQHKEIESLLLEVFTLYPVPSDAEIAPSGFEFDLERIAIQNFLAGKTWFSIVPELQLNQYNGDSSAILPLLSDQAFVYYFPAFLLISVRELDQNLGWLRAYSFIYFILGCNSKNTVQRKFCCRRLSKFSLGQLQAIKTVLEYLSKCSLDDATSHDVLSASQLIANQLNSGLN